MSSGSYSFLDLHSDMETFALMDGSEGSVVESMVPAAVVPCDLQDLQAAKASIDRLSRAKDPFDIELGSELGKSASRLLPEVFHLQQCLPMRFKGLKEGAQQVRDVLGSRVNELLEGSELNQDDLKRLQSMLSEVKSQLFGTSLRNLMSKMKKVAGEKEGYDVSLARQEERLFGRLHSSHQLSGPLVESYCCLAWFFSKNKKSIQPSRREIPVNPLSAPVNHDSLPDGGFGGRIDFHQIQKEASENLRTVQDMQLLGSHVTKYLKTLEEDFETIQSQEVKFEQLLKQVPHLGQSFAARGMSASMLHQVLCEWDLQDCADQFLQKNISGKAFVELMTEKDFRDLGFTDDLTLRRLKQAQDDVKNKKTEFRRQHALKLGRSLNQSIDDLIKGISQMEHKYCVEK